MRPAGRAETDSLYFDYPHFDPPAARDRLTDPTPVAIVGAGPVGMTAALALARQGIASVVFDAKDSFNDGSRAICVARQSYHILDRLGAVAPFLEKSLGWTTGRSFYRGHQILEFDMPDSPREKYRPMYNIEQQYIEQYLWDAIARDPLIDTRWQSEVTGVTDTENGVRLTVRDPKGSYDITAAWLLAADGARSTVRTLRGLRLKGDNFEGRYVIADVQMDHDYPTIRRALFDPDCRRGGTILVHKQPDNIWRIDYQLRDGEDETDAVREENVRGSVAAVLDELGYTGDWDLEWWSIYSANTLALDDYRDGRIFFIGDSAHIVPIFGVRGLNNGIADADNIAWKLARVIQGQAGPALLDSYTPERRGATLDVFANASKSARFMTPPTKGWALMRDAALNLALDHPFAGELANPRQMTPYSYADSPIVSPDDPDFDGGPVPGAPLPEARVGDGFLSDRLGPGFSLIAFDPDLNAGLADLDLTQVLLPPGSQAAETLAATATSAYLVRPDGHIAARWADATPAAIRHAFALSTAGETT
ncbi:3-(3-hydroxy-phenyl)propionate/3-hydroxycinnamic acid hydroxylase [Thalassovita gelatinovora]|uniref:3-(3-hydroxy-phenyl)propionate/3-hydroxycinnamic acid hydroxylase n=1 Tax=Thalassovita gelatinovora TaxID=53501 RepID=A0A0P1F985_THAGE|nr:FAD-dependent monooxygenase [Thalassovita gelatinovora]QIZ80365.1 NAD(P)-binding protein [Thalassovita gelatinovora]CUH64315.1 3-(3-hydroxy-phenyl)propionate/3-hydroxycinnamic acid hydroxylase [Thalassovita gelatinovora]SEQ93419.1 3-(3-hydroxy-phenyl)propionate hydroxylase [Thalassovita gelatinovora]